MALQTQRKGSRKVGKAGAVETQQREKQQEYR